MTVPTAVGLGMITPSSNTVLEPTTVAMLRDLPEVTAHFARFRVLEISDSVTALQQFDQEPMLEAARLLADARVKAIAWNGTSAGWLGFHRDEELCRRIEAETDIPAASSVLALNEVLRCKDVTRLGLVTPYLSAIQDGIIANYRGIGIDVVADRRLEDPGNWSFATYDEATIAAMIRDVALARPQAITMLCTNFRGAALAADLEAELSIPIYDSVATAVWQSLRLAGFDPRRVTGWGSLFALI
ncbi:MAG: aspartate/glutamate racemase family protein [Pseudomonadota bacterium]